MKTDEQVARYRKLRELGKSQELAAAMSSMTAKTARKYEVGLLPSQTKAPRDSVSYTHLTLPTKRIV